jgi:hypothetical protein
MATALARRKNPLSSGAVDSLFDMVLLPALLLTGAGLLVWKLWPKAPAKATFTLDANTMDGKTIAPHVGDLVVILKPKADPSSGYSWATGVAQPQGGPAVLGAGTDEAAKHTWTVANAGQAIIEASYERAGGGAVLKSAAVTVNAS